MSNPYTTQAISGYNADAPPDDGTEVASNQLTWAKHKTKLADPLKTLAEAINSQALTAFGLIFGQTITSKGTNYTVTTADQGSFLSATAAITFTLPAAGTAGDGFAIAFVNNSTGAVTIDGASSETIDGNTSITLGPTDSAILTCDSSSWSAVVSRRFPGQMQSKSGNYTVLASDDHSLIEVTATATITLLDVASAGAGFRLMVYNSSTALVTLDGATSETINGSTTLALYPDAWAILTCDGSSWTALVSQDNGQQHKKKTADEVVNNSNTLQDDDHLIDYVLEADTYYQVSGFFEFNGQTAADAKFALVFTDAPQELTVYAGETSAQKTSGTALGLTFTTTDEYFAITGAIRSNASTGGTVKLQWAQNSADVSDTTFEEPSWLNIDKVII